MDMGMSFMFFINQHLGRNIILLQCLDEAAGGNTRTTRIGSIQ
jgi:hypothetical protein